MLPSNKAWWKLLRKICRKYLIFIERYRKTADYVDLGYQPVVTLVHILVRALQLQRRPRKDVVQNPPHPLERPPHQNVVRGQHTAKFRIQPPPGRNQPNRSRSGCPEDM